MKKPNSSVHNMLYGILLFSSIQGFAQKALQTPNAINGGDRVGGGSDYYLCNENGKQKAYLLEMYHWKSKRPARLGPADLPIKDKLKLARDFLWPMDPLLAEAAYQEAVRIHEDLDAELHQDPSLGDQRPHKIATIFKGKMRDEADSKEIGTPEGCSDPIQLALQYPPNTVGPEVYYFNKEAVDFKNKTFVLDADNYVGALNHEALYRILGKWAPLNDSVVVQDLNTLILSGQMLNTSPIDYAEKFKSFPDPSRDTPVSVKGTPIADFKKRLKYKLNEDSSIGVSTNAFYAYFPGLYRDLSSREFMEVGTTKIWPESKNPKIESWNFCSRNWEKCYYPNLENGKFQLKIIHLSDNPNHVIWDRWINFEFFFDGTFTVEFPSSTSLETEKWHVKNDGTVLNQ